MKLVLPIPPLGNRYWRIEVRSKFNGAGFRVHYPHVYRTDEATNYIRRTAQYALANGIFPTRDLVKVTVDVYRARRSGDVDGFVKVLLDALQGCAFEDDKQVIDLHARRFDDKADPRVEVEVLPIDPAPLLSPPPHAQPAPCTNSTQV